MQAARLSLIIVVVAGVGVRSASAQEIEPEPAAHAQDPDRPADIGRFIGGAAVGLVAHEAGHLVFDAILGADPRIVHVRYGPIPFFAVSHASTASPRREFAIDSAGFWVQEATNEWILSRRPQLRSEHAPFTKGLFAFNVLLSVGYAVTAFAQAGPYERDTRGMAAALRVDEPAIGALVLAPAVLDAWRYLRPDAVWARWASRVVKVGSVLLVAR